MTQAVDTLLNTLKQLQTQKERAEQLSLAVFGLDSAEITQLANTLRAIVLDTQPRDAQEALDWAKLIAVLATQSEQIAIHALSARLQGFVRMASFRDYHEAVVLFEQSESLYESIGDTQGIAELAVAYSWALAAIGKPQAALARGEAAKPLLAAAENWRDLATLLNNIAAIYGQQSDYQQARTSLLEAISAYEALGPDGERDSILARGNLAFTLRFLGQYDASIALSRETIARADALGLPGYEALLLQNIGDTLFKRGRVNEAISALGEARASHEAAGREKDAVLVDQELSRGLLYVGRDEEALSRAAAVASLCDKIGIPQSKAAALTTCALAQTALGRHAAASDNFSAARQIYAANGNPLQATLTRLESAIAQRQQDNSPQAQAEVSLCLADSDLADLPIDYGRALLLQAALHLDQGALEQADVAIGDAQLAIGPYPVLAYRVRHLAGRVALARDNGPLALEHMLAAMGELEQLQGWMLPQLRPNFLRDKDALFHDAFRIAISLSQPDTALEIAERAKAQALLAMLTQRVGSKPRPRSSADAALIDALAALRERRNLLFTLWESQEFTTEVEKQNAWREIGSAEKEIDQLWQQLLLRNASYAKDAATWRVQAVSPQPYLAENSVMLEYFMTDDAVYGFIITSSSTRVVRLPSTANALRTLQQQLQLNFAMGQTLGNFAMLVSSAQTLLAQLYAALIAPFEAELAQAAQLVIVPHGGLHYLPFAALFDGDQHLVERFELRQLPASSFLAHYHSYQPLGTEKLITGFADPDLGLDKIATELSAVAEIWSVESHEATLPLLSERVSQCVILHLAAHGVFRADNPLFSGIRLADGWLTTLDVFDWQLSAELVTLSACETGRTVVSGGDELLGLMQAFMSAGAASLLMTLWSVEDSSTAQLMAAFYQFIKDGHSKCAALRAAQRQMIASQAYNHPYFWSAFILVGADGGIS